MIECKSIIICENVIIDKETNAPSLINIIVGIHVPAVPIVLPIKAVTSTYWETDEAAGGSVRIRLLIQGPDGNEVSATLADIPEGSTKHRQNFTTYGLKVETLGKLKFIAQVENRESAGTFVDKAFTEIEILEGV